MLLLRNDVSLGGTGTLTLNGVNAVVTDSTNSFTRALTVGAGQTINGYGQFGQDQITFTNNGLIDASAAGRTLTIDSNGANTSFNPATLRASAGTLAFAAGVLDNTGGTIASSGTGTLAFESGFELQNGTISAGTGNVTSGTVGFTNVTNAAAITVNSDTALAITTGLTNNGTIALGTGVNNAVTLVLRSDVTLAGTGTLTLNGANAVVTDATNSFTRVLTNAAGHTINGFGQVGQDQINVVNAGTIAASGGGTLTVDPSSTLANTGTLRATNGGSLLLTGGAYTNTGTIEAVNSLPANRSGITLTSGATITNFDEPGATLNGGTYRGVNGNLFIAPFRATGQPSFDLAVNNATIELVGESAATTLFRDVFSGTGRSAAFRQNDGTLVLADGYDLLTSGGGAGGFVNNGTIRVSGAGRFAAQETSGAALPLTNAGTLAGTGTFTASTAASTGLVSPGDADGSAGTLTIDGNYTQADGAMGGSMLDIELAGLLPGTDNDVLSIGGTAGLAGALDVTLLGGFNPTAGETFTVLTALGGVTGTFDAAALPAGFTIAYLPNSVVLTAPVPEPTGLGLIALTAGALLRRRRRWAC